MVAQPGLDVRTPTLTCESAVRPRVRGRHFSTVACPSYIGRRRASWILGKAAGRDRESLIREITVDLALVLLGR